MSKDLTGKKRKPPGSLDLQEENQSSLFKSKSFLEYQNKNLATLVLDLRGQLTEKDKKITHLERVFQCIINCFNTTGFTLINFRDMIKNILDRFEADKNIQLQSESQRLNNSAEANFHVNFLKNILNFSSTDALEEIDEKYKIQIETMTDNLMGLIENVMSILSKELEIKKSIESGIEHNLDKFQLDLKNEYLTLKNKEIEMNNRFLHLKENNYMAAAKELSQSKNRVIQLEAEANQLKSQLEEMSQKLFVMTRKYHSNPTIPYITLDKNIFGKNNTAQHTCICHVCGENCVISNEESGNQAAASESAAKDEPMNGSNSNPTANANQSTNANQLDESSRFELEYLKNKREELFMELEDKKLELRVNEDRFLKSKAFQVLLSQAETMMLQLDSLKEANLNLFKKKAELEVEKNKEIREIEQNLIEKKGEIEKKYLDMLKHFEEAQLTINKLNLKIETLEITLKAKENLDLSNIIDTLEQDKQKLNKQLETQRNQNKELVANCDKLKEQVYHFETLNIKLTSENERLKQNWKEEGIDPNPVQIPKFDVKEREEMKKSIKEKKEKIFLLEKRLNGLKTDLQSEKDNAVKLISLLELNEKGLEDLNKKIKIISLQFQEEKEKNARLTNEKVKDNNTKKLLVEAKDTLEKQIATQDSEIQTLKELVDISESEKKTFESLIKKMESEEKLQADEINQLKVDYKNMQKRNQELASSHKTSEDSIRASQNNAVKYLTECDQLKLKLEELQKRSGVSISGAKLTEKSLETIQQDYEYAQQELEELKAKVKCGSCQRNDRNAILLGCFHTFCKDCLQSLYNSRNRKCPHCKNRISSENEIKTFWWN